MGISFGAVLNIIPTKLKPGYLGLNNIQSPTLLREIDKQSRLSGNDSVRVLQLAEAVANSKIIKHPYL
jgi:hypothetical protein